MWPKLVQIAIYAVFISAAVPAAVFALLWTGWSIVTPDHATAMTFLVAGVAATVLLHSVCTALFILRYTSATHRSESFIFVVGLVLVVFGSAWLVWAIHLGLVTADWEYYGIVAALATAGQGLASVLILHHRARLTV